MNLPKIVVGQQELEAIYSASRKADLGADQHERLRGLAQTVMAVLQQADLDRGEAEADKQDEPKKA